MNIQQLNGAMENMKKNIGGALMTSSIIGFADGQTIAHYNSDPKTDALLSRMTSFLVQAMSKSNLGEIGDYYIIDLDGDMVGIVLLFDDYCWAIGIDKSQMPLGMVLNVVLPDVIKEFKSML